MASNKSNFYFVPLSFVQDIMEWDYTGMFYELIKPALLYLRLITNCILRIKIQTYILAKSLGCCD